MRAAVILLVLSLTACNAPTKPEITTQGVHEFSAVDLLAGLAVKGKAPHTGYSRLQFGVAWTDIDHNGCDTRNDILNRDLTDRAWRDSRHCVVISGTLHDPYTATTIVFAKAQAAKVQIDHVIPLSEAWSTGAQQWSSDKRLQLANDPLNLLAVDGAQNESKGDSDAASWLPPNQAYRCSYVERQVEVKAKYGLWVTRAEGSAIRAVLQNCANTPLPSGSHA